MNTVTTDIIIGIKYTLFLTLIGLLIRAYFKINKSGCTSVVINELSIPLAVFIAFMAFMFANDAILHLTPASDDASSPSTGK